MSTREQADSRQSSWQKATVTPASSATAFLTEPTQRYFMGRNFIVFCHSPALLGHLAWGRPDVNDVREMLRLCEIGLRDETPPHRWWVDLRGLEFVEPGTFGLMVEYVKKHGDCLGRKL